METPLLRVSRPVSACARCRGAKIRCDGKLPACSACEKAGKEVECSSSNDQFAKGKERSYVSSLESRVEKLERQIKAYKHRKESTTNPNFSPLEARNITNVERIQRKEASDVDELVSDFGYLSVNAAASDYYGFTKEMSFSRLALSTATMDELPPLRPYSLPERSIALTLAYECIHNVLTVCPVLTDTAILGSLETAYEHGGRFCSPLDVWNIRMVLAIGLMTSSTKKGDTAYEDAVCHAAVALEQRDIVVLPGTVESVQAVLLLVLYSLLDPSHYNSWCLIGLASKMMVDIGLHGGPYTGAQAKAPRYELRRRIFHCVYTLDRLISMSLARPFSFTDDSVDLSALTTHFPSVNLSGRLKGITASDFKSVGPDLVLIRFRQLQSSWYQTLFASDRQAPQQPWQTRAGALHTMTSFVMDIHDNLSRPHRQMIDLELLYGNLLLVMPLVYPSVQPCSYGKALALDYVVEYVQIIYDMCNDPGSMKHLTTASHIRTLAVGRRAWSLVLNPQHGLFNDQLPQPPVVPAGIIIPPLRGDVSESVRTAITALTRLEEVLCALARRFDQYPSNNQVKNDSFAALDKLYTLRQQHTSAQESYNDSALSHEQRQYAE